MVNIFFDTSALFSAVLSSTGAARELVRLGVHHEIAIYISEDVIIEARRNISGKANNLTEVLDMLFDLGIFLIAPDISSEEVAQCALYTEQKDAMIVASAIKAQVNYLATFDRKHLIDPIEVRQQSGLFIGTPGDVLGLVRGMIE